MSIEYKDIMSCEKLSELPDGSYIVTIVDGDMKIISKENAKFGGGSVTKYIISYEADILSDTNPEISVQSTSGPSEITLLHSDGTEVTAKELYDAYLNGIVQIEAPGSSDSSNAGALNDLVLGVQPYLKNGIVIGVMGFTLNDGDFLVGSTDSK